MTAAYGYDALGRLTSVDYSDSTPDVAYAYDRLGRQTSAVTAVSTNSFVYSGKDLVSETQNGDVIRRDYDENGRAAYVGENVRNPSVDWFWWGNYDFGVHYTYDGFGRLSGEGIICPMDDGFAAFSTGHEYHQGSDLIAFTGDVLDNLLGGDYVPPISRRTAYEPLRDLVTGVSNFWDGVRVSSHVYRNDALGRRIARDDSHGQGPDTENAFVYNARSEVTNAAMGGTTYSYAYDPIVMDATPNTTGVIMGCLMFSALITFAVDPFYLLGKPFTLETAVSLWPSNSVIQTQCRKYTVEPTNMRNPIWTQEAYLVDRPRVDDNSIWYQEPVVEYDVSKSPTNTAGILTGIRLYIDATNQSPALALLSRCRIAIPSLTNMCMRFPNQAWTGIDRITFHEDRTIGTNNLPPVRVFYCFEDGRLDWVIIALPPEAPDLCRSKAAGARNSSESIIDLSLLRHPRAIHVLGEHDMWVPKKNSSLEKMKELREGDRAIAGEKVFRHLKELGVFPVAYIRDGCSRPPESEGLYASYDMGIVVETTVSGRFALEFDAIEYIFVNLKKVGKDVKIRIAEGRFLPKTEVECKKNAVVTFESRRYDGEYKIWLCEDGISFLINKDGDVCMVGVNRYHAAAMNEYFMRRMIRCYEAQSILDL